MSPSEERAFTFVFLYIITMAATVFWGEAVGEKYLPHLPFVYAAKGEADK